MRSREFINESPELAEKYKAHLIKTLPLLMNFLSKTSKDYLPTEDEMLDVVETGYEVMLQSGDKNKAGEAVRNKLKSLISNQSVMEGLEVDVPNEEWLQYKIDYAKKKGRDRWGAPFFNATTAYFNQDVRVPIQILRRLPGMRNEQKNVRTQDLITIKKIMKDTGKLPMHNNKEYVPFIMVAYNGEAWVNEGNHRIMAAAELFDEGDKRFAELPIELRYFDGGERVKSGPLSPEKIGNQNVMEGSYREGGSITHDGVEYDFDSVMSIAEKMPTKTCSVDKLSWVLEYDTPNKERLERADITVPLIVTKSVNGKLAAIDGLHRLAKAVRDNVKTLPVKYIKPSELESAKLNKQGVAEGKIVHTYLWHGSRQKITMLEPRQAVDTGGAAGSNQNAIYATADPKIAIAMGMPTADSDYGHFPNDPQMVLFSGKIRKGEYVYLHKLPFNGPDGKPQFVQGGNSREFHSIPKVQGIKPIEIKKIPVNKYLNLVRKATPADLKLRKKYVKKKDVSEVWSEKYKRSINCNNPKGFSQRAHCAGRKKRGKSK